MCHLVLYLIKDTIDRVGIEKWVPVFKMAFIPWKRRPYALLCPIILALYHKVKVCT